MIYLSAHYRLWEMYTNQLPKPRSPVIPASLSPDEAGTKYKQNFCKRLPIL